MSRGGRVWGGSPTSDFSVRKISSVYTLELLAVLPFCIHTSRFQVMQTFTYPY